MINVRFMYYYLVTFYSVIINSFMFYILVFNLKNNKIFAHTFYELVVLIFCFRRKLIVSSSKICLANYVYFHQTH